MILLRSDIRSQSERVILLRSDIRIIDASEGRFSIRRIYFYGREAPFINCAAGAISLCRKAKYHCTAISLCRKAKYHCTAISLCRKAKYRCTAISLCRKAKYHCEANCAAGAISLCRKAKYHCTAISLCRKAKYHCTAISLCRKAKYRCTEGAIALRRLPIVNIVNFSREVNASLFCYPLDKGKPKIQRRKSQ